MLDEYELYLPHVSLALGGLIEIDIVVQQPETQAEKRFRITRAGQLVNNQQYSLSRSEQVHSAVREACDVPSELWKGATFIR